MATISKIAITGPESSGKSTLVLELAKHYSTSFVSEIAREYLEQKGGSYQRDDLLKIAEVQLEHEKKALKKANRYLFCDTNLLTIIIWSKVKYGLLDKELINLWKPKDYVHTLLCYPDIAYKEDPLREHPSFEDRINLFDLHEENLRKSKSTYTIIKGSGNQRLQNAISSIDALY